MSSDEPRVLIVDDDAAILKVLSSQLAQAGMRSYEAQSAERALEVLDSRPVDVVLTDLRMPGVDGMALLQRVVRSWPEVPVIVLTAHGTIELAVETMKAGAADFIVKPFDRDEVLFVVRKAFAVSRARNAPPIREGLSLLGESGPHGGGPRHDSPRRSKHRHGVDPWRDRHGQGARGQRRAPAKPPSEQAFREAELRGATGLTAGE